MPVLLRRQRSDVQPETNLGKHQSNSQPQLVRAVSAPNPLVSSLFSSERLPNENTIKDVADAQPQCAICFEDREMLQLHCQHCFCAECLAQQLASRWPGPRVVFGYLNCGLCRVPLAHEELELQLREHKQLRDRCVRVAERKFCDDGLDGALSKELGYKATADQVRERAEANMVIYLCVECSQPFCAGRADCAMIQETGDETKTCGECAWAALALATDRRCMVHGHLFAIYKCDSCCAVAVWCCDGHHYCDRCHGIPCDDKHFPCPGPGLCPLGLPHPRNSEGNISNDMASPSFVLGCSACLGHAALDAQEDLGGPEGYQFGYPLRDWGSFTSGEELLEVAGDEEVRSRLQVSQPGQFRDGNTLSTMECAERLLLQEHGVSSAEELLSNLGGPSVGGTLVRKRLLAVGFDTSGQPLECAQRLLFLQNDVSSESLKLWDARRALQPPGVSKKKRPHRRRKKIQSEAKLECLPLLAVGVSENQWTKLPVSEQICDIGCKYPIVNASQIVFVALVGFWSVVIGGVLVYDGAL